MLILYLMLASMLFIDVFMGHVLFTSLDAWWSLVEGGFFHNDEPLFDPQRTLELSKKSTQIALNVYWVICVLSFTHGKSSTVQSAFRCTHS